VPAIGGPLPGVAERPVEAEGVGGKAVDLGEQPIVPLATTAVAIGFARADVVAPPARRGRACARGLLRLGFSRQAIGALGVIESGVGNAHLVVQPGEIFFSIVPIQADRRPTRRLSVERRIGLAIP